MPTSYNQPRAPQITLRFGRPSDSKRQALFDRILPDRHEESIDGIKVVMGVDDIPAPGDQQMPSFHITGIDHVVVRTADLERALAFYRDVLGLTVEREQPELGLLQLRAGRSLIDLVPGADIDPQRPNIDHFALEVDAFDEPELRAHLAARGIAVVESGLRYGAGGEGPSLYIHDPDGNKIELKAALATAPAADLPA